MVENGDCLVNMVGDRRVIHAEAQRGERRYSETKVSARALVALFLSASTPLREMLFGKLREHAVDGVGQLAQCGRDHDIVTHGRILVHITVAAAP